jgi:hypothetical protein
VNNSQSETGSISASAGQLGCLPKADVIRSDTRERKRRPLSHAHRAHISAGMIGKTRGRTQTPEHRAKNAAAHVGRPPTAETRRKIGASVARTNSERRLCDRVKN